MMFRSLRPFVLAALLAPALSAGDAADPFLALPALPKVKPEAAVGALEVKELAPGVQVALGKGVVLTGSIIIDQGPVDGLEVVACLAAGKTHESLVRLVATDGKLVNAAFKAAFGMPDGVPAPEATGVPARGTPLRVVLEWQDPEQAARRLAVDVSCLVRDRSTDKGQPALPFIYTGSRFLVVDETGPDGKPVKRERYMLDSTKSVVAIVDEPDALIASPSPGAGADKHFEVYGAICPPAGTAVRLVFTKAELPLSLDLQGDGRLRLAQANGAVLEDVELEALLARHFGAEAKPLLRAVAVMVAAGVPREHDVAARTRILTLAAAAKAWVVPVFVLKE
jgi:hypothetical protein